MNKEDKKEIMYFLSCFISIVFFSTSVSLMLVSDRIEVAMSDTSLFVVFALSLINLLFSGSRWVSLRVSNSK